MENIDVIKSIFGLINLALSYAQLYSCKDSIKHKKYDEAVFNFGIFLMLMQVGLVCLYL